MSGTPFNSSSGPRQSMLFESPPRDVMSPTMDEPAVGGKPRLRCAEREQVQFRACSWDDLLPDDHQSRIVWDYELRTDLSRVHDAILAVEGRPGHPPIDPRILFPLWMYVTLRGIGSARELARRCDPQTGEVALQWICGDVTVNHHTLADFRVSNVELLDETLTKSIAVLRQEGLVTLERVTHDGMKVRASAGADSFRRGETLQQHYQEAQEQVAALKQELEANPGAATRRQQAARERAERERAERLAKALEQLPLVEAQNQGAEQKANARVSTTDPEARVMTLAAGGYRPAYNVQLGTDCASQIITGVDVTNSGGDQGKLAPMVELHVERHGQAPEKMLVDGGFAKKYDITAVSSPLGNTTVYGPVQKSKKADIDPRAPWAGDSEAVQAWRARMATDEAKEIYKDRAATAECVNADFRNHGLLHFRVRGRPKVLSIVL